MRSLADAPAGLGRERLIALLPRRLPREAADALLDTVCKLGRIQRDGAKFRIPEPGRERTRALEEHEVARRLELLLLQRKLTPPEPKTLLGAHPVARAALARLIRDGVVVRTVDRVQQREILFHRQAIRDAQEALAPHLTRPPGLLLGEAAAILGITRKYAVPLMEYLDAIQFSQRRGDRRLLACPSTAFGAHEVDLA